MLGGKDSGFLKVKDVTTCSWKSGIVATTIIPKVGKQRQEDRSSRPFLAT